MSKAVYDYLPTYHQVEPNNLKGLQPGFVVAQMEVAPSATGTLLTNGMFENGKICTISADGIIPGASDSKSLFISYTEPLLTLFPANKFFAVDTDSENVRLVQLIPGDEWMSDMDPDDVCIEGRIVEVNASSTHSKDDWFGVTTLADGTSAHHYMYIG